MSEAFYPETGVHPFPDARHAHRDPYPRLQNNEAPKMPLVFQIAVSMGPGLAPPRRPGNGCEPTIKGRGR